MSKNFVTNMNGVAEVRGNCESHEKVLSVAPWRGASLSRPGTPATNLRQVVDVLVLTAWPIRSWSGQFAVITYPGTAAVTG